KAAEAHLQSVALLDALVMEHPDEARFRVEQAKAYRVLANALHLQAGTLREKSEMHEKTMEAEEACRRALGILDLLAVEQPDESEYRYQLALTYQELGTHLVGYGTDRFEDYVSAHREAIAILKELVSVPPTEARYAMRLANAYGKY